MFSQALTHRLADAEKPVNAKLIARALDALKEARTEFDAAEAQLRTAFDSQQRLRVAPTHVVRAAVGAELDNDAEETLAAPRAKMRLKRG